MSWKDRFKIQRRNTEITQDTIEEAVNKALADETFQGSIKNVSEETSLSISAVWACVRLLSDTVSILPVHLYKRGALGREKITDHMALDICNNPNSYSTRYDLLQHLMVGVCLWGNGYCRIYRDKFYRPVRLKFLEPYEVEPQLTTEDELFYRLSTGEIVGQEDIIHIKGLKTNGIKGKSPIAVHRENLILCQEVQSYGETFFSQGGNVEGVFSYPSTLKEENYKRLKKQLFEQTVGMKNAHSPLLLEGGMKYDRINIPLEDAQFISTRKFQKTEIATIYGVPPHMIADLERATNNNIEHQSIEFVIYCLMPYLVRIELELSRKLLRYDEMKSYYFSFILNGLLRGDSKTRSEYYKNMNLVGAMNANEIRELEDMNKYSGGEMYFVQQNMQTVENAKKNNDGKE